MVLDKSLNPHSQPDIIRKKWNSTLPWDRMRRPPPFSPDRHCEEKTQKMRGTLGGYKGFYIVSVDGLLISGDLRISGVGMEV